MKILIILLIWMILFLKKWENAHRTVYSQYFWTSDKRDIILTESHIMLKVEVNQFQYSRKDTHFAIYFKNYTYFLNEWSNIVSKYIVLHILFFDYQFNVKWWKEGKSVKFWTTNLAKFVVERWFWTNTFIWTF